MTWSEFKIGWFRIKISSNFSTIKNFIQQNTHTHTHTKKNGFRSKTLKNKRNKRKKGACNTSHLRKITKNNVFSILNHIKCAWIRKSMFGNSTLSFLNGHVTFNLKEKKAKASCVDNSIKKQKFISIPIIMWWINDLFTYRYSDYDIFLIKLDLIMKWRCIMCLVNDSNKNTEKKLRKLN